MKPISLLTLKKFWQETGLTPQTRSEQLSLNATLQAEEDTASFSIQVVDENYPLYGQLVLEDRIYKTISETEILLDENGAERLKINIGDKVTFGDSDFTLVGIIKNEPTSLLGVLIFT